jgi:hypothetical protein
VRAVYTGHEVLTFSDYLDLETGRTLTAVPGGTYDMAPASGRLVPDVPAGWFAPAVEDEPQNEQDEQAEPAGAADGEFAPEVSE